MIGWKNKNMRAGLIITGFMLLVILVGLVFSQKGNRPVGEME